MFIRQQRNKNVSKILEFSCRAVSRMNQLGRGVSYWEDTQANPETNKVSLLVNGMPVYSQIWPRGHFSDGHGGMGKLEFAAPCE